MVARSHPLLGLRQSWIFAVVQIRPWLDPMQSLSAVGAQNQLGQDHTDPVPVGIHSVAVVALAAAAVRHTHFAAVSGPNCSRCFLGNLDIVSQGRYWLTLCLRG